MGHLPGRWDPPAWGGAWKGLLLAASVLGSCLQPVPAQSTRPPGTIVLSPPSPAEGGNVSLVPPSPPQNTATCAWYRSETEVPSRRILTYFPSAPSDLTIGPAHTGRETGGPGCALHIAGVTLSDTGNYSLLMEAPGNRVLTAVLLRVWEMLPRPTVTPNQTLVPENGTFSLTCNSSLSADTRLWLRDGEPLGPSRRLVLSPDNHTLTVLNVTRGDAGAYQCEVRNAVSSNRSEPSPVTVTYRPPNPSPEPPSGLSPGAIAGIVIGSLAGAALVGGLLYFLLCRNGRGPEQHVPVGGQAASPPSQDVGDKKPTMADPDVHYSTLAFGSGAQKPAPGPQPQRENGTVYSEIKKK